MTCIQCRVADNSRTLDTRLWGGLIRRRRECLGCKARWSTVEIYFDFKSRQRMADAVLGVVRLLGNTIEEQFALWDRQARARQPKERAK